MRVIVTFGQSHAHSVGEKLFHKDNVAVIEAESHSEARRIAWDAFEDKFCTSHLEKDFDAGEMMMYFPGGKVPLNFEEETNG